MAEEKKDWGWLIGGVILLALFAPKVAKAKIPPAPPSPTDNPSVITISPTEAQGARQYAPIDYSPTLERIEKLGIPVIAKEETIQYGKGLISPTVYITTWIDKAKEAGYVVPAEEKLKDYYAGKISYAQYRAACIEEVKPPAWYIELWDKYVAGIISYDTYLTEYARMVGL